MSLFGLIIFFVVLGFVAWAVNTYVPMPRYAKAALNVLFALVLLWCLLEAFGVVSFFDRPILR